MKRMRIAALTMVLACGNAHSQTAQAHQAEASGIVKVYQDGHGVSAPELLPIDFGSAITDQCDGVTSGKVTLSLIVDATGHPRDIVLTHPLGNDLDKLALVIAAAA